MERWKMLITGTEKQNTSTRGSQKIRRNAAAAAVFILPVLIFLSCRTEVVPQAYRPTNAHEEYEKSLAQAGLSQTALVMDWIASSETALENPIFIYPPFKERVYFDPSKASSVGYSFSVKRGQKISIEPASGTSLSFRLYVDLFRTGTPGNAFIHTASGSENSNNIDIDVRADGEYILRLQPELLRGGSFTVTIQVSSSLAFPVKGHDSSAFISWFGDSRNGGTRKNEGIDILAPRGTEVVSPSRAYVRRLGINRRGGSIIWMQDSERNINLYFAHLDTQLAEEWKYVQQGETIGTVDPFYYIHNFKKDIPSIRADTGLLGQWTRAVDDNTILSASPEKNGKTVMTLDRHTLLQVVAASAGMYRVSLPNGLTGYVDHRTVEAVDRPIQSNMEPRL
jgi:murein DD-endopeptidase MepM/ murein hydrolase activator NlpD